MLKITVSVFIVLCFCTTTLVSMENVMDNSKDDFRIRQKKPQRPQIGPQTMNSDEQGLMDKMDSIIEYFFPLPVKEIKKVGKEISQEFSKLGEVIKTEANDTVKEATGAVSNITNWYSAIKDEILHFYHIISMTFLLLLVIIIMHRIIKASVMIRRFINGLKQDVRNEIELRNMEANH